MIVAGGIVLGGMILLRLVPRALIRRGQDRRAREILGRGNARDRYQLLTRAERFVGSYRRLPGVLGMRRDRLVFESRFEPPWDSSLSAIRKISTGKLLSTGRRLLREEVLTLPDADGAIFEFQM